jgi:hypothetical protein
MISGLICLLTISFAGIDARADETLKFRQFMHATAFQSQEVGDVDGHAASIVRFSGLAELSDGSIGTSYFVALTDYTKGEGPFSVYDSLTLKDGSVLWFKMDGTATVDGATSLFKGTVKVLGGKGKFEGAKGDGTVTGARYTPVSVGADLYNDIAINLKK